MKVRKTITMDSVIAGVLDANCTRHGDVTWHVENALTAYFKELSKPKKEVKAVAKIDSSPADAVIDYLNQRVGTKYQKTKSNRSMIEPRLKAFTVDDCRMVIDKKCAEWMGTEFQKFLRPATLFQESKFEGYLNQVNVLPAAEQKKAQRDQEVDDWVNGIDKPNGVTLDHEPF